MTTDARCWNCKHWEGDREAAVFDLLEHGMSRVLASDPVLVSGGRCRFRVRRSVYEDEVAGGFSCILHEPEETDDDDA